MRLTDWDHNAWYAGTLVVPEVDAVDRSPGMVAEARRLAPGTLTLHRADAMDVDLPEGAYDAVLSSSVLHHLPLAEALPRMAGWVRPGGVLAAVAVPRVDLARELPVELAARATHHGLGFAFAALRPLTGAGRQRVRSGAVPATETGPGRTRSTGQQPGRRAAR